MQWSVQPVGETEAQFPAQDELERRDSDFLLVPRG